MLIFPAKNECKTVYSVFLKSKLGSARKSTLASSNWLHWLCGGCGGFLLYDNTTEKNLINDSLIENLTEKKINKTTLVFC